MIKRLAVFAVVVSLGGCATPGGTPPSVAEIFTQVQQAAVAACGFAPTISTIANIVAAGNPGVMTATALASAICAAIAPQPKMARLQATGRPVSVKGWIVTPGAVNGVPVR